METNQPANERERLREHFLMLPPEQQVNGWDTMWEKGVTPWDRAQPNPALVEALEIKPYLTESPFKSPRGEDGAEKVRKKALVPGCGGGYDVQLFASYGYDAYGIDGSPIAVEKAKQHLRDQSKEQKYKLQNVQKGRGGSRFILGDFFEDDFLSETHDSSSSSKTFDIIYDYTFLCALPPPLRPKWAARMSKLLAPQGTLICTEYPLGKDPRLGGPPFGLLHPLYEQLLNKPGDEVSYDHNGKIVEDSSGDKTEDTLVEIESWVPNRIFEPQKGQVMVSVWKHRKT